MTPLVLHAENDEDFFLDFQARLRERGIQSVQAVTAADALKQATAPDALQRFTVLVMDLGIRVGESPEIVARVRPMDAIGHVAAQMIRERDTKTPILALTWYADDRPRIRDWFERCSLDSKGCRGFYNKRHAHEVETLLRRVEALAFPERESVRVPFFILHGHDHLTRARLCAELERQTCAAPVILDIHEHPGLSVLEQFERYANRVAGAFALMTEDDWGKVGNEADLVTAGQARARQNVIFEIGYCLGKFGRESGRTFLLTRGTPEIPSDLHGLPRVPLDDGVEVAVKRLKNAIDRWC